MIKKGYFLPLIILTVLVSWASFQGTVKAKKVDHEMRKHLQTYLHHNRINGIIMVNGKGDQPIIISNRLTTKNREMVKSTKLFPIGSLQKIITGVAIYHLVQENKLSWDTPLSQFYPQVPGGDQISVQQLMTHTSGLRNDGVLPAKVLTSEEKQENFFLHHFTTTEDYEWSYQDIDFQFLAAIIRQKTHQGYFHYLKQTIFGPLKLHQVKMAYQGKSKQIPQTMQSKVTWQTTARTASAEIGAGDLLVSPNDYWKFITKGVLNNQQLIQTFVNQPKSQREAYFGGVYFQGNVIRANGNEPGYNCCFFADYRTKRTLMLFTNNIDYPTLRRIANDLYRVYYGDQIQR